MKLFSKKKIIIIIVGAVVFTGAYFVLGGYGRSGPDAAPNLAEHGLVGYWNMEEGKGQTVYDRSGNGNNGTLGASTAVAKDDPVFTSGYSSAGAGGTALKFDGVDDYVNAGNGASLNITGEITLEAWAKVNALDNDYQGIVANWNSFGGSRKYGLFIDITTNKFSMHLSSTGADNINVVSDSAPTIGAWYHVVGTRSSDNQMYLYVNGVKQTDTDTISGIYNNIQTSTIGWFASNVYAFNGSIDEVRIYNRALSADEIRQHYNQKKPILEWKFDEGSGTTTKDESFNNNDGTLHE